MSVSITDNKHADGWYSKGHALSNLERYGEAIECFDKAIELKPDYSQVYLLRGKAKYQMGYSMEALEDFKKMENTDLDDQKHNNKGLYYYQLGLHKEAEEEYRKAVEYNPKLAEAYYNLALLHINKREYEKAKRMLENCLTNDSSFSKAREALQTIKSSPSSEWFEWWFGHGKGRTALGIMIISSILVPLSIFALIINEVYILNNDVKGLTSLISGNFAIIFGGIITTIGIMVGILLLPSLQRFKVISAIELETIPIDTRNAIRIEPSLATIQLIQIAMPLSYPMQLESFHMPLQSFRMPLKYPLKSVRMPLKSAYMPETHEWLSDIFLPPLKNVKKRTTERRLRIF